MVKKVVILLILSVVVTLVIGLGDFAMNQNSIQAGFPFKFTSAALMFGNAETNYLILVLDIIFWFIILYIIWTLIKKLTSK